VLCWGKMSALGAQEALALSLYSPGCRQDVFPETRMAPVLLFRLAQSG
jgi:hypothetical protein